MVLLLTLAVSFLIFVLLRMRPGVSPAVWCIAGGLLGVLLVLEIRVIYRQVENDRLQRRVVRRGRTFPHDQGKRGGHDCGGRCQWPAALQQPLV